MAEETDRRSFLSFFSLAIIFVGAVFSAVLGAPIICYVIDPRHRKGPKSAMKLVDGIKLNELDKDKPHQGVVRDTRTDGWTLYPNDVIGRVWVIRKGDPPDLSSREKIKAFNASDDDKKKEYLLVFTTICPHLGCSVNMTNDGDGFLCPCHGAGFDLKGVRDDEENPAKRDMDSLDWEIDESDRTQLLVTYQNFKALEETKVLVG